VKPVATRCFCSRVNVNWFWNGKMVKNTTGPPHKLPMGDMFNVTQQKSEKLESYSFRKSSFFFLPLSHTTYSSSLSQSIFISLFRNPISLSLSYPCGSFFFLSSQSIFLSSFRFQSLLNLVMILCKFASSYDFLAEFNCADKIQFDFGWWFHWR